MTSSSARLPMVRVFMPTYRRPALLPRAVESLRKQTVTDWVCEVHNDDPRDEGPATLLRELNDPRFELRTHEGTLGPLETFNRIFRAPAEPYYAVLEDDNWWEPTFLEEMIAALNCHPEVTIAWSNQRIWIEQPDHTWVDSGGYAYDDAWAAETNVVQWGHFRQALGALHANGSLLIRSRPGEHFSIPRISFGREEAFRERTLPHPLLYVPRPLANFAVTLSSARPGQDPEWCASQVLLLASFVRHGFSTDRLKLLWRHYASERTPPTNVFILAGLLWDECRPFLAFADFADWARLARRALLHPGELWNVLRVKTRHPDWWEFLDQHTAARVAERGAQQARAL